MRLRTSGRSLPSAYTLWSRLARLWDRFAELAGRAATPARQKLRLAVEGLEDRLVPDGRPLPYPVLFAGSGMGDAPVVKAYAADTGALMFTRTAYESSFTGGVRVAAADLSGDGFPDLVVAPGPGSGPHIRVLDGHTGDQIPGPLGSFWAFEQTFTGGVHVAAADVNGDGVPDVIAAAGWGGGPRVRVFSGKDGQVLSDFYAFEPDFTGGVSIAAADFDHDGKAELVVGAGKDGGPRVKVYHPLTGTTVSGPLGDFFAFDQSFRGGVSVGTDMQTGDVTGDGVPDIAVGAGPGMGSRVKVFDGKTAAAVRDFSPYGTGMTAGVTVATLFADNDKYADVAVGTGAGVTDAVRVFSGLTSALLPPPMGTYAPFGSSSGGVEVAASNDPPGGPQLLLNGDSQDITVVAGQRFSVQGEEKGVATPTGTMTFNAAASGGPTIGFGTYPLSGSGTTVQTVEFPEALSAGTYTVTADYSGDSTHPAGSASPLTVTVTAVGSNVPSDQPPVDSCPCAGPVSSTAAPGIKRPSPSSAAGVDYASGWVSLARKGPASGGFGTGFGTTTGFTTEPGVPDGLTGVGSVTGSLPQVVEANGDASVAVVSGAKGIHYQDSYMGAYHARYGDAATLTHSGGQFVLTDGSGQTFTFYDFSAGTPSGRAGRVQSIADAAGNLTQVTSWDSSGAPGEVQRVSGTGASALTESFLYAYVSGGSNAGRVSSVTQRTQVGTGSWSTVRTVEYTYYTAGTGVPGRTGDLKTQVVKDESGNAVDTTYFRYYTAGGSGGGSGTKDLVKYAFGPAAYGRLAALAASLSTTVDGLSDTQVAPDADTYLEYDSSDRVTKAVSAGSGCSACSGGQGEFDYSYTANSSWDGSLAYNVWKTKTVETLPDGTTNTVYTNPFGEVMLKVHTESSQSWLTYDKYDDAGRVVLEALPSAVTGYSESNADLVGYSGGNATYLSDSAGLLTAYTYGSSTTATTSTAGDAAGYLKEVDLLHGETGTPVPQQSMTYIVSPAGTFAPASATVYRNADGTGGQTTTTSYTWQGSTAQVASATVTLPTVTTGQNGPGTATSATTVFDTYGRVEWQKDAGGFLTYTAHDPVTGAVVKQIVDVDTTQTSDFADLPSGWSTPTGGGLHLITTYEVDDQGRATKVTYPNGRVDYSVYNDAGHETRSYPGWDTTTNRPTGPTTVMREDRAGNYTETLTMSAAPTVSSGRPTGAEAISAVQSLSREYRNDANQVVTSDVYFDLGGLAYSTSTSLGTAGVNFYRTQHGYDDAGRPDRMVSPEGTVYRTVYDGLGRKVSEWVGTDDTPTSGEWSPTNTAGTDLVKVREYQYDGGGVGDGNLTKVTEHPGLSQPDRVTQTYYDWRDRAVVVKAGVETSESTSVNRPITYTDYDNLGEATKTRTYDGDGVSVTSTGGVPDAPSSSLLRSQTTTSYDELGRAYRRDTSSVDPSSGSVGANTLYSLTWYDSRGNTIKTLAPGGQVQKMSYDGAGRATTAYTTDGGGDSAYSDAGSVTGDTVLEQVETTYDPDGNATETVTRQRFHDASGTGALGTPSSGVFARVSYSANYFDKADRPTASVKVGTNGGSSWTRPSSVPSRSDTVLVTSTGYTADAVQVVRLTGSPTGGTFTLTFGGQTTAGIAYNASTSTVLSALAALSSVGSGNVVVTAAVNGGWQVRFAGSLAGSWQTRMTASGSGLTGGTSPGVAVSTLSLGGDVGRGVDVTDPRGLVTRNYFDPLGRVVQTVEDFTDGAVTDSSNKTTDYAYNSVGRTSLTAEVTGGGGQTTGWVYGVTQSGSGITSNDLVGATRWPDPSTGAASSSQQETVTVNALGQMVTSTDRNGSVHTQTYDVLGRIVSDAVTTLGSGVDGAVRRIETAYDGQGNPYLVTSYDAASSGNVVNQVQRAFNGLGQLVTEYQSHSGAVNTSTTPKVQYAYSEMPSGADHSRPTSVTYPSGYVLTYNYSSGLNDGISRLSSLSDSTGTLESYSYLGLGTVVVRSHPQPGIDLTYVKQGSESNGDAGDPYTGLDRFGRVVDQRWIKTSTGTATDRFQYGYDRDSNVLYRDNLVNAAFGELYTYDGLNQLASFARGTLNSTKTAISGTASRSQSWDYDAVGNWDSVTTNGSTQTRSANKQNEITSVSGATTPAYDSNGNTTADETGKQFVYDAWNRVVMVKNSAGAALETFGYDGLNRRVSNTVGSTTTDRFYSAGWQVLEEKVGSSTTARYVWSPVYVDAMVLRDRDTDANGTLDERLWTQQDANWNVTAVATPSGVGERYIYDSFGALSIRDSTWVAVGGSSYDWTYGHQGGELDVITGQYTFRKRMLSPSLGRWITPDSLGYSAGSSNLFGYVDNDPTSHLDPSGLVKVTPDPDNVNKGKCGDLLYFRWTFELENPMPVGGVPGIVTLMIQKVSILYFRKDCDDSREDPEAARVEYYEVWKVDPGQTLPTTHFLANANKYTDEASYRAPKGTRGDAHQSTEIRVFQVPAANDPASDTMWSVGTKYYADGYAGVFFSGGPLPTSKNPPPYWDSYDRSEQIGCRTFSMEWNCCAEDVGNKFTRAEACGAPAIK
jgi:RHS repeat-associated protein